MVFVSLSRIGLLLAIAQMGLLAIGQECPDQPQEPLTEKQIQEARTKIDKLQEQAKAILEMKPIAVSAKDDELRRLLKERFNAAIEEMRSVHVIYEAELATFDLLLQSCERVRESGLELFDDPKDQIELLTNYVTLAKLYEAVVDLNFRGDNEDAQKMSQAKYHRCDAEIRLLRAKKALEAKKSK